jgi:hypothetical protein
VNCGQIVDDDVWAQSAGARRDLKRTNIASIIVKKKSFQREETLLQNGTTVSKNDEQMRTPNYS